MRHQMIPSMLSLLFKNKLNLKKALEEENANRERIKASYVDATNHLQASLDMQQKILEVKKRDLEDVTRRVEDRTKELERTNEELRQQIRLIEAKSSPSSIWESAFSSGFDKAWEIMLKYIDLGDQKAKTNLYNQAVDDTLKRLNGNRIQKT